MEIAELKNTKVGEFLRLSENGPVWVRGKFERSSRKFSVYRYDDVNDERFWNGNRKVIIGFEF